MIILLLSLSILPSYAVEGTLDLNKLTPAQTAALQQQAQQYEHQNSSATVRAEVEEWGKIGANIGQALVGAAKEVGVAAADFAQTPVGKIVVFIIVLKVIGGKMIAILAGIALICLSIWAHKYISNNYIYSIKYEVKPILFGLWNRKIQVGRERDRACHSDLGAMNMWILVVGTLGGIISIIVAASHI